MTTASCFPGSRLPDPLPYDPAGPGPDFELPPGLEAAEPFDRLDDADLLAREQHLPRKERAVQLTE